MFVIRKSQQVETVTDGNDKLGIVQSLRAIWANILILYHILLLSEWDEMCDELVNWLPYCTLGHSIKTIHIGIWKFREFQRKYRKFFCSYISMHTSLLKMISTIGWVFHNFSRELCYTHLLQIRDSRQISLLILSEFRQIISFLFTLKSSENLRLSDDFRGIKVN